MDCNVHWRAIVTLSCMLGTWSKSSLWRHCIYCKSLSQCFTYRRSLCRRLCISYPVCQPVYSKKDILPTMSNCNWKLTERQTIPPYLFNSNNNDHCQGHIKNMASVSSWRKRRQLKIKTNNFIKALALRAFIRFWSKVSQLLAVLGEPHSF